VRVIAAVHKRAFALALVEKPARYFFEHLLIFFDKCSFCGTTYNDI
jgi:hypothetical protein